MATPQTGQPPARAQLSLWDATSIVVGVVIGVGIYESPPLIFQQLSGPWEAMGAWVLGGLLSLIGALCFAELASTYPRSGGEYVYLTRAYGSWVGFFFAWAQLTVIRTGGGIALLAYVFADYAATLHDFGPAGGAGMTVAYATLAILVLTSLNVLGLNPGKRTQNILTVAKVLGVLGVVLAGFLWAGARPETVRQTAAEPGSFALAMIFVLYAYDGWNEAVYVATEVQDRRRNLPLALLLGTGAITIIYLLINAAYLAGLSFPAAQSSGAIAADVLALPLGDWGARAMSVLVMVSALGALNGMILTGSRIYPELGADHPAFAPLARWSPRLGTPVCSLVIQAAVSIAMVAAVGTWWQERRGFEALVRCTAPVFWFFFLLTGVALFVLRLRDRGLERPFRVPLYPWLPLIFCGWSGYMLYGSIRYAGKQGWVGIAILLAGLPVYLLSRLWDSRAVAREGEAPAEPARQEPRPPGPTS
ncbi:MAG TPA: amino acid permease [Gemmataceae bacterium]|nr:amino acid permease [Gemmataceae bacterium]